MSNDLSPKLRTAICVGVTLLCGVLLPSGCQTPTSTEQSNLKSSGGIFLENEYCSLQVLESPGGGRFNKLYDVSGSGEKAVGLVGFESPRIQVFVWKDGQAELIPIPEGYDLFALEGISRDGSALVGNLFHEDSDASTASVFSNGQYHLLPSAPGATIHAATAISDDGRVVVGYYGRSIWVVQPYRIQYNACMWVDGQLYSLGLLLHDGDGESKALYVSSDGSVIFGYSSDRANAGRRAFRWENGQTQWLGDGMPVSASADGESVLCRELHEDGTYSNYVWSKGQKIHLDPLPGMETVASTALSRDGTVILGFAINQEFGEVVMWRKVNGYRPESLNEYIRPLGLSPNDFQVGGPSGISDDLSTIVGAGGPNGQPPFAGYILRIKGTL